MVVITTARALVHSRRIGGLFKVSILCIVPKFLLCLHPLFAQHHNTTLTVEVLEHFTSEALRESLNEVDTPKHPPMGRTTSQPNQAPLAPVRRSTSESYAPHATLLPPPVAKSASMFSNFIRRKKKTTGDSGDEDDEAPPPAPPKDKGKYAARQNVVSQDYARYLSEPQPIPSRRRTGSISEFAVISHSTSSDEVVVEPVRLEKPVFQTLPLRGKWAVEALDTTERLRRAREEQRQRAIEEQQALREEEKQKAEWKRRRDEQLREDMEYEARRRASLEEEVRRMTVERKIKERMEKEEEERKTRELEERKRLERERRMLEHRKLEEWRREQARLADEAARKAEEARQREEDERRKKISIAEAKLKRNGTDSLLTGWVTMQTHESLFWKRRYFKFIGSTAYFYRSPSVRVTRCICTTILMGRCCRIPIRFWTRLSCAESSGG